MYEENVVVGWSKPLTCSTCGEQLNPAVLRVETFPYIHADLKMVCTCGEEYLIGIPHRRDSGLSLHVYDSNPAEAVTYQQNLTPRICRFGHGAMNMTKIFGDWVLGEEQVEYQWKCSTCFLTRHEIHKRTYKTLINISLTSDEKLILRERLKRMGYIT